MPRPLPMPVSLPLLGVWLLCLVLLALAGPVQGQGLSLSGLAGESDGATTSDPEALRRSLDEVIATLEDGQRRDDLVARLKELREATTRLEGPAGELPRQGLLGALADTFSDLGDQAESGQSPLDAWQRQLAQAAEEAGELARQSSHAQIARVAFEAAVLLAVWLSLLSLLMALGRWLISRRGLPATLPREPKAWLVGVHFLRRVLPWLLAFLMTLALGQSLAPNPGRDLVLVVAYVALCGRLAAAIWEALISVFTRGHRFVAVQHLRQRTLRRLFVIGALVALADALDSSRLIALVGGDLASFLSVVANALAALLSGLFVVRFKRPIKHLIRNRPYHQRRVTNTALELVRVLGGLWHIPALLMVGASLLAIFVSVGDAGGALTRALANALLLILTLVVTSLIRRHGATVTRRKRISQYRRRLEHFGYALAHILCWLTFAELSLQVWGTSLIGFGGEAVASARIGKALLAIGFTVLLAWLAWIFADTAIQRALTSSARARGRRVNQARAQTITPMIRNIIFAAIVIIAAIVGLANLGVNVTPLLAGAGVIGLAIGFGAQTLVQDLITGIFILIEDSLAVDDFVRINSHMGTVEGLTLRTVRLRDLDGVVHIITFSRIDSIHNMSRQFGTALMKIRIPHDMKIDDAIALMQETAQALRQDPVMRHHIWSPLEMQGIQAFEEGCPVLRMRFRTAPEMQWDVSRAFNLLLKQRMEAMGVDLAMPRLNISMEGHGGGPLPAHAEAMDGVAPSGQAPGAAGSGDAAPDPGR